MKTTVLIAILTLSATTMSGATGDRHTQADAVNTTAATFVAMQPCRVVDTRNADGPFGGPIMTGGSTRSWNPRLSACGGAIPADVVAYSLNFGVVLPVMVGNITAFPTGEPLPDSATVAWEEGGTVRSNNAIVPAGTDGSIDVFTTAQTHLGIDITGYFVPAAVGSGDITGVTAGTGLVGGGTAGSVVISIADGGVDTLQLADGSVTLAKIDTSGAAAPGDVLTFNGTSAVWQAAPTGGDIDAVNNAMVHTVTADNICSAGAALNASPISLGGINGNHPEAIVLATPNGGVDSTFPMNTPVVGVAWVPNPPSNSDCPHNKWVIYTLNGAPLPIGAKYSIFGVR